MAPSGPGRPRCSRAAQRSSRLRSTTGSGLQPAGFRVDKVSSLVSMPTGGAPRTRAARLSSLTSFAAAASRPRLSRGARALMRLDLAHFAHNGTQRKRYTTPSIHRAAQRAIAHGLALNLRARLPTSASKDEIGPRPSRSPHVNATGAPTSPTSTQHPSPQAPTEPRRGIYRRGSPLCPERTGAGPSIAKYKHVLALPPLGRAPPSSTLPPRSSTAAGASVATTAVCASTSPPPPSVNRTRGLSSTPP